MWWTGLNFKGSSLKMKTLLFDIGGVIHPITVDRAAEYLGVTPEQYLKTLHAEREDFWNKYTAGDINSVDFACHMLQGFGMGESDKNIEMILESIGMLWGEPDTEIVKLIRSKAGNVGILSNSTPELEQTARSYKSTEFDYLRACGQNVFFSHIIGLRKPNEEAFLAAAEYMGKKPKQIRFIDDKEENILAARRLGMEGVLYKGPESRKLIIKRGNFNIMH